MDLNLKP